MLGIRYETTRLVEDTARPPFRRRAILNRAATGVTLFCICNSIILGLRRASLAKVYPTRERDILCATVISSATQAVFLVAGSSSCFFVTVILSAFNTLCSIASGQQLTYRYTTIFYLKLWIFFKDLI